MIPKHMQPAIKLWVDHGLPAPEKMGSFFRAVLSNDLRGAVFYGDAENRTALCEWVSFIYNELPSGAHGGLSDLRTWHERGGLLGRQAA